MVETIKLPSGLKVNKKWKPTKSEFTEAVGIHYPFNKMQESKRVKEIEKDWKAYSKVLSKDKKKEEKEEGS